MGVGAANWFMLLMVVPYSIIISTKIAMAISNATLLFDVQKPFLICCQVLESDRTTWMPMRFLSTVSSIWILVIETHNPLLLFRKIRRKLCSWDIVAIQTLWPWFYWFSQNANHSLSIRFIWVYRWQTFITTNNGNIRWNGFSFSVCPCTLVGMSPSVEWYLPRILNANLNAVRIVVENVKSPTQEGAKFPIALARL